MKFIKKIFPKAPLFRFFFRVFVGSFLYRSAKGLLRDLFAKLYFPQNIVLKFETEDNFSYSLNESNLSGISLSKNPHNLPEIARLHLPKIPTPKLIVLIGDSGIGKTSSICLYAKILRKEGNPVYYYSFRKPEKEDISLSTFLKDAFGTEKPEEVIDAISNIYSKKNMTPTFIIDNIHFCQNEGELASPIFNFINDTLFQKLRLNVVMLSSNFTFVERMATEVFFLFIFKLGVI